MRSTRRRQVLVLAIAAITVMASSLPAIGAETPDTQTIADVAVSESGSYVVIMDADPLIAEYDASELNSKKAKNARAELVSNQNASLKAAGLSKADKVNEYTVALNGYSAIISHDEATAIARQKGVAMVLPDELRQLETDNSGTFLGLNGATGPWASGYDGEGVVVGIIDSGIWPEHPSFADDGSYNAPPITLDDSARPACEFGSTTHTQPDAEFECNNKLIGARQMLDTYRALIGATTGEYDSARDEDGHGTHTASTAAGNAGVSAEIFDIDRGVVSGVAPRAHVVSYKGLGILGGFGSDLASAIDQAVADGVDVINYSIGSGSFAIGPDDVAFLFAADAGVHVATSNGNGGPGAATTGSPASVPWLTSVGASTQDRTFQGSAVSSDGWEFFGASITAGTEELTLVDAEDYGNALCDPLVGFSGDVSGTIVLCVRGAFARVDKSLAVYEAGGTGMILYNQNDGQSEVTDNHFVPSVHINNTDGLVIKDYIDSAGDDAVAAIVGGEFTEIDAPWMASFSSRGPNRLSADIIKPDVTAPGVNILAGNTPTPTSGSPGELFQSISGTSMSSPHVAGIFALMKQAHPEWTPAMAKSALMTTAHQDVMKEDGATAADPFDMGAGHVVPGGDVNAPGSLFNPGIVYDAGLFEYAAFTCGAELGVFTSGTCAFLEGVGVPMNPTDLNLPSIGIAEVAGPTTVTRTVTNILGKNLELRPVVEAPAGFDVTIEPRMLILHKGETASYTATFTPVTAIAGEWEFGSLTWTEVSKGSKKGGVAAYSPIAVKAAAFVAPPVVNGTGTDGATSFDVSFGYTGEYTAAEHGLVPATLEERNVLQDPDQAFDPNDGFSNIHEFETSGDAFLKISLPPEATEPDADLDIFLFDPDGNFHSQSTNGGTDELLEVVLPADGTWTLYVQGWAAPGGDSDYTVSSWIVSATPGGSLSIDAAPTSATLGTTETITVSWTGLTSGTQYLGAVSHADAGGLLGLTLVEVDG